MNPQPRTHRKPPDVEEALSSMLWTPYDNHLSESDSSEGEAMATVDRQRYGVGLFGQTRPNQRDQQADTRRRHHQHSLMRRSLSAWSYRAHHRADKARLADAGAAATATTGAGNRFSYPYYYYDQPDWALGVSAHQQQQQIGSNHTGSQYYGAGGGLLTSAGSRSFHGGLQPAPWATLGRASGGSRWPVGGRSTSSSTTTTSSSSSSSDGFNEKRQYLPLPAPFVGRWHRLPTAVDQDPLAPAPAPAPPPAVSSLPFSLLGLDTGGGGIADSYRDDYQVYPAVREGESIAAATVAATEFIGVGASNVNNNNNINNNNDNSNDYAAAPADSSMRTINSNNNHRTCNNNNNYYYYHHHHYNGSSTNGGGDGSGGGVGGLSIISAMLQPPTTTTSINPKATSGDSITSTTGNNGNSGDLHFSKQHSTHPAASVVVVQQQQQHRKSASTTAGAWWQPMQSPNATAEEAASRSASFLAASSGSADGGGIGNGITHASSSSLSGGSNGAACFGGFSGVRNEEPATTTSSSSSSCVVSGGAQTDRVAFDSSQVPSGGDRDRVEVASFGRSSSSSSSSSNLSNSSSASSSPSREHDGDRAPVMRLNVPAAGAAEAGGSSGGSVMSPAETGRTSVYIPSVSQSQSTTTTIGGDLPALTIQVNRLDPNNQQQNDVVNNASSGVSIVSCYRAASAVAKSDAGGGASEPSVPSMVATNNTGQKASGVDVASELAVNTSSEHMVQVPASVVDHDHPAGGAGGVGVEREVVEGSKVLLLSQTSVTGSEQQQQQQQQPPGRRTYTSTEAQTDATTIELHPPPPGVVVPAVPPVPMLQATGPGLLHGPPPPLSAAPPPGSEFSTREHRRRERRERRQARNRLQHIHPLEAVAAAAAAAAAGSGGGPGVPVLHPRSPPPLEIIPDILHSHLPPPYTTLPMGATMIPQMIPANAAAAVAAAAAAAAALPVPRAAAPDDCRYTFPIPIMRSSPSERSRKGCCGHWFAGPPLRALIAVVALGGVACALGGAALGATGLAGSPTSHLTAALLMIGVGVILVTVSGAAWRMTAPGAPPCLGLGSTVDLGRCSRRPCGRGGSTPHGLLYPEFQHRPPPPSYQASMQEYRLRLLLLDRDRQSGRMRSTASPPPTYRSNVGSLLRIPLSSRYNNGSSNSIFGGISGIISGAVGGGGSSNSVVDQQLQQHHHQQHHQYHQQRVSSSPNGAQEEPPNPYGVGSGSSDGHSTLPPSYRSVELHPVVETVHRQPQPQSSCTSNPAAAVAAAVEPPSQLEVPVANGDDDGRRQSTTSGGGTVVGSIIKIDDRRNSTTTTAMVTAPTANCNEPPTMTSGDTAAAGGAVAEPANQEKHPLGTSSISSSSNTMVKDLVTIVTISGTIEPSSSGVSVYTTSSGSSSSSVVTNGNGTSTSTVSAATQAAAAAGGSSTGRATCTLLNSNSTPLLATVIPVSKAVTATTRSTQPAVVIGGPVLQC